MGKDMHARNYDWQRKESNKYFHQTIEEYTVQSILDRFFSGTLANHAVVLSMLSKSPTVGPLRNFCVMTCLPDAKHTFTSEHLQWCRNLLNKQLAQDVSFVCFQSRMNEIVVLAADKGAKPLRQILLRACDTLAPALFSKYGLTLDFGVGEEHGKLSEAIDSYHQARSILYGRTLQNIMHRENGADSVESLLAGFHNALANGEFMEAEKLICEFLYPKLKKSNYPYYYVRWVYGRLMASVFSAFESKLPPVRLSTICMEQMEAFFRQQTLKDVHECFYALWQEILQNIYPDILLVRQKRIVKKVQDFIQSSTTGAISLTEAAEYVSLSPSYLSRVFKKETGVSFVEYVKRNRIERAKIMLCTTDKKVFEICDELGYNSLQYFTTLFKSVTTMTPSEYKQKFRTH